MKKLVRLIKNFELKNSVAAVCRIGESLNQLLTGLEDIQQRER
jgi:hypothetical protein